MKEGIKQELESLHLFENSLNKESSLIDKRIRHLNDEIRKLRFRKKRIIKAVSDNMKHRNMLIRTLSK